jgi:hypothetical protein
MFADSGRTVSADALIAYVLTPPSKQNLEQMVEELRAGAGLRGPRELASIAVAGDPRGWPGLTAPAIAALSAYFARPIEPDHRDIPSTEAPFVFEQCLAQPHEEAYYQRLQPLCVGLAVMLARQPAASRVCLRAARILREAPTAALVGPLRSWIDVFAQRIEGDLSASERTVLLGICEDRASDGELADVVAELAQRLQRPRVS